VVEYLAQNPEIECSNHGERATEYLCEVKGSDAYASDVSW